MTRALLSVWDKTGLDNFAYGLAALGTELVASGGTASHLEELGLEVTPVEELTEVPELLGGRVKTLHPRVHAGILARPDRAEDLADLDEHAIGRFDIVCVNLYPFEATSPDAEDQGELVELIDVGGVALLRAAAKNFEHVAAVSRPDQYGEVLEKLNSTGAVSAETRRRLAAEAFATTARYDGRIAARLAGEDCFPETLVLALERVSDLAYGENPHQRAAYYTELGSPHLLSGVEQLGGRPLSLINIFDLAAGRALLDELEGPACVIVKHGNPCGAALGSTIEDAYEAALSCDPVSAFGMACVLNGPVSAHLGARLAERFVDVIHAPAYEAGALEALRAKPATRILAGAHEPLEELDYKRVPGGLLVQDRDDRPLARHELEVVCGSVEEKTWRDVLFASAVCKHVTSNAIVVALEGRTIGIGSGQVSRVDAVRLALDKAHAHGHDPRGAVLASDGFFPFPDGPQLALDAGVATIVQPGGSRRDADVIDAARRAGAAMVFTHRRQFRH